MWNLLGNGARYVPWGAMGAWWSFPEGRVEQAYVRHQEAVVLMQQKQRVRRVGSRSTSRRRWKETLFLRIEKGCVEFAPNWEAVELLA